MVVTFDDGYAGNYEVVFPIVQAYQIPVTVYVATRGCQDNGNYWFNDVIESLQASVAEQVREMAKGSSIALAIHRGSAE